MAAVPAPLVSVVVPTRDRAGRLAALLDGLRAQSIGASAFEVLVCDDASTEPEVGRVLDAAEADSALDLRVLRRARSGGPAVARNLAWREARAPLVAFVDDDCVPTPRWLEAVLDARDAADRDDVVIQGPVDPDPAEYPHRYGPFSTTLWVKEGSPWFETANIAYPRALLQRLDGFDERLIIAGEDSDLGWRAVEAGAAVVWAADALVHHGVIQQGPRGRLLKGWRWRYVPAAFARHEGLRRQLQYGVFWNDRHRWLFGGLLALLLLRRRGPAWSFLRWWFGGPLLKHLTHYRTGPALAPYRLACEVVEVVAIGQGAIRHRVLMI